MDKLLAAEAHVAVLDLNIPSDDGIFPNARLRYIKTDVSSESTIAAAASAVSEWISSTEQPLAGLICAAGMGLPTIHAGSDSTKPSTLDNFDTVMNINFRGTVALVNHFVPQWRSTSDHLYSPASSRGAIILVSSITAFEGQAGMSAYVSSKAALQGFSLSLTRELAEFGIRVMTISPGIFDTPLAARLPESVQAQNRDATQFPKRAGRPDEFGALACHILENEYLNGSVIRIDGGESPLPVIQLSGVARGCWYLLCLMTPSSEESMC